MIVKKFNPKKQYNFGCVISTYNRKQILEKTLTSLSKSFTPDNILFVFVDDNSVYDNYFDINQDYLYYKKNNNLGISNSLAIGWDIIWNLNIPYMLNIDSDVLLSVNWLSKILNTHKLFKENIITTGFNGSNHFIVESNDKYFLKKSIGGINLFFNRQLYPTVRKSLTSLEYIPNDLESIDPKIYGGNPKLHHKYVGWDWSLMTICDEKKIKRICTNPSVVQHIGDFGLTSSPKKFEKSSDFKDECVPKVIHQTWMNKNIPEHLMLMQKSILQNNPEYEYKLWTDDDIDNFILENYPQLNNFYNSFEYTIQKIDFARLLIVYHFGGIYIDLDSYCYKNIDCILNKPISFVSTKKHKNFKEYYNVILNNALIASEKNNLFLKEVINNIILYKDPPNYKFYSSGNINYTKILKSAGPLMITETYMSYEFKSMVSLLDNSFYYGVEKVNDKEEHIFELIKSYSDKDFHFIHIHESSWWKKNGKAVSPPKNPKRFILENIENLLLE